MLRRRANVRSNPALVWCRVNRVLAGVVFVLFAASGAVVESANAQIRRVDSSAVQLREVPEDKLDVYRADARFDYDESLPETGESLWAQFNRHVSEFLRGLFATGLGRPLMWLIAIGILVFALSLLLGRSPRSVFYSNRRESAGPIDSTDLLIEDFADRINNAIDREDYREAIRLRFARALRDLSNRGSIVWARDKTNRSYRQELAGNETTAQLADTFGQAATWFDYAWYGHSSVDADRYARIDAAFRTLEQEIAPVQKPASSS